MNETPNIQTDEKLQGGAAQPLEAVVPLRRFDGADGVLSKTGSLEIHRAGSLVDSAAGTETLASQEEDDTFSWAVEVAGAFPARTFCISRPQRFDVTARIGTASLREDLARNGAELKSFYDPTLFECFDGELELRSQERDEALKVSFWEWPRRVANLDAFPKHRRRVVDLTLPAALAGHEEDLVLLHRLSVVVCEAVGRYVDSGGEEDAYDAGLLDNLFAGGEPPLPQRVAPALQGRSINNVYQPAPPERLARG